MLQLAVQGIHRLVGEEYPQHEDDTVDSNHAIHAEESQQPLVGIETKVATQREEGDGLHEIGCSTYYHREGEDAEQAHERVGEEVGLLALAHQSHAQRQQPHHNDECGHTHTARDEEIAHRCSGSSACIADLFRHLGVLDHRVVGDAILVAHSGRQEERQERDQQVYSCQQQDDTGDKT